MSSAEREALLEVRGLSVTLGARSGRLHILREVNIDVAPGETVCIVGESGCGKSMTSLALMGLLPVGAVRTAEYMRFEGRNILSLDDRQMSDLRGDRLSMIFQEPMTALNPVYTIGDQLAEPLFRHRGIGRREAYEKVEAILESVGISGARRRLAQYPHQLSGGLRQRVFIAMALVCKPSLLIADEPTTALDVTIQVQILQLLKQLQTKTGMGMLFITHDLGLVARLADRVLVMYAGQVIETGTVEDIFRRPSHPYTQGLLRCIPVIGANRESKPLGAIPGMVPHPAEVLDGCAFRARCPASVPDCSLPRIEFVARGPYRGARCIVEPTDARKAWQRFDSSGSNAT